MPKKENKYQHELIGKLKSMFPECIILKNDANYVQGIPDLSIFYGKHWAMLETKRDAKATHRPNQDYYVNKANSMSFSRFVYPENEEEVLNDLQHAFEV